MPKTKAAAPKTKSLSPPLGLVVGNGDNQWEIGKRLGEGACGSVHELLPVNNKSTKEDRERFVIKVAKDSSSGGNSSTSKAKKKTKKKKSEEERMADLLHYEHTLYKNLLVSLCGTVLPVVPCGMKDEPPSYGKLDGYRFLVMEKMGAKLSDVPGYIRSKPGESKIPTLLGLIAAKALTHLESLHAKGKIFVDIKIDNFMFHDKLPSSSSPLSLSKIADSLRLIDIGLMDHCMGTGGHREDEYPGASMNGTPLYASINVMEGHTASRRDDLEALGYVIVDLLLMTMKGTRVKKVLSARSSGNSSKDKPNEEEVSSLLPWRDGNSDDNILKMKQEAVESGSLFRDLSKSDAKLMSKYFGRVRNLDYSAAPEYDEMRKLLCKLCPTVFVEKAKKKSAIPNSPSKRKRSVASSTESDSVATGTTRRNRQKTNSETTRSVRVTRSSVVASMAKSTVTSSDDEDDDENIAQSCLADDSVQEMDWDPTPVHQNNSRKDSKKKKPCLMLSFVGGPGLGETLNIYAGVPVTVGKKPDSSKKQGSTKNTGTTFSTKFDKRTSDCHLMLEAITIKGGNVQSVKVTDLGSGIPIYVNNAKLSSGGYKRAFKGDKIMFGESTVSIEDAIGKKA